MDVASRSIFGLRLSRDSAKSSGSVLTTSRLISFQTLFINAFVSTITLPSQSHCFTSAKDSHIPIDTSMYPLRVLSHVMSVFDETYLLADEMPDICRLALQTWPHRPVGISCSLNNGPLKDADMV